MQIEGNMKLIGKSIVIASLGIFMTNQAFANERNKQIGQCVAGAQFQLSMMKRNPTIIGGQINKETIETAKRFLNRVESIDKRVNTQCKDITLECLKKTLKNNDDYQIAVSYYELLWNYMEDKSTKMTEAIIFTGNSACYLLNQKK